MRDSGAMKTKDRGIRQRDPSSRYPKGGWEVRWTDPEGFTKRRTFRKKIEATDFLDGIREDMKRSRYIDPKRAQTTVRSVVEEWLASLDVRPTTEAAYRSMVKTYIVPGLGNVRLDRVSRSTLLTFKKRLDDLHRQKWEKEESRRREIAARRGKEFKPKGIVPLSSTRKHHVFQTLSTIFTYAVQEKRIDTNPIGQLNKKDRPKRKGRRFPFLDAAQVDSLAQAVDPRYRTLVYFLGYSGLRAGEAVALRIEDIDWEEGSVRVDESISDVKGHFEYGSPKTDESERTVPLPAFILNKLRDQIGDRALNPRAFVFPDAATGRCE
jgi:integrase